MAKCSSRAPKGYWEFVQNRYFFNKKKITILAIAIFILWVTFNKKINYDIENFSFWLSAFFALAPLAFTAYATQREWHQTFKKYMNINYICAEKKGEVTEERIVMRLENVPLIDEADLRAYSQQVATQANYEKGFSYQDSQITLLPTMDFHSTIHTDKMTIEYSVERHIQEKPKRLKDWEAKNDPNVRGYILWDVNKRGNGDILLGDFCAD